MTTPRYIAFHNSKSIHAAVVARYEDSARLKQGIGYDWKTGCGCLMGLLLNEFHTDRIGKLFEEETNLPAPLAHVLNLAFESSPTGLAEDLPAMFFGTLATGAVADNFMLGLVQSVAEVMFEASVAVHPDIHSCSEDILNIYRQWNARNGRKIAYYQYELYVRQAAIDMTLANKVPHLAPEVHWWYTQLHALAGLAEDDTLAPHHLIRNLMENGVLTPQKLISMLMQEVLATPVTIPLAA
ncbi:MAG: hypothetical protein EON60_13025 [Alphaproteobacteria bacterium]|nr:MAG: hypothetical protein EON60_13025 [Alphaproteobacteria bacterium]